MHSLTNFQGKWSTTSQFEKLISPLSDVPNSDLNSVHQINRDYLEKKILKLFIWTTHTVYTN